MKYNRYPKYKDSGVEWIGEIPEGWEVVRLKHNHAQVIAGQSPSSSSYVDNGRGIQFLQGCETFGDLHPDPKIRTIEPTKIVQQNTVLISVRAPVGTLNIANSEICIGRGLAGIVAKENNLSHKFLYYFLNLSSKIISGGSRGTTFQSIRTEELENSLIVSMPYEEQIQISDFLDKQTTQFDELIAKSKAQVTLLEEKRQATITQAVTKGLDPSVPMKDSGVEWIGEIPEGWEVMRLRRLCRLRQGLQIPISDRFDKQGPNRLPYITVKTIHSGQFDEYIENPSDRVICYENNVLLARTGNTGEVVTNVHGVFHNNFFAIDFDNKTIGRDYLIYFLEQKSMKENILLLAGTTTIPDLNHDDFLSLVITVPPYKEQIQIVEFLKKQTTQFDELIAKSKAQITLLEEKRQALITTTVTGKIDVRSEVVA